MEWEKLYKISQYKTNGNCLILQNIHQLAEELIGKTAHVEWPYMVEALITSVCNDLERFELNPKTNVIESKLLEAYDYEMVQRELKAISGYYFNKKGIKIGDSKTLVQGKVLLGQR